MNKWMKRAIVAVGTLAVLAAAGVMLGKALGERKMQRVVAVAAAPLVPPSGPVSLQQGRYLYATRGCADCHGDNGAGKEVIRSGAMLVVSPNITAGPNSATARYTEIDWVRTLRQGVKPDGRPVLIMPSEDYNRLTDDDLRAVIGYVQQLPPVAGRQRIIDLPAVVKLMYAVGVVRDAWEMIDHSLPPEQPVKVEVSVAHGAYVSKTCMGCHGPGFSGGRIAGSPPEWPASANLTAGQASVMPRYPNAEAFMVMMRSGKRPDGSAISPVMPFGSLRQMSDTDLRALYSYLKTLPPRAAGGH
jgi:mono/diheme cytochrome c family protein